MCEKTRIPSELVLSSPASYDSQRSCLPKIISLSTRFFLESATELRIIGGNRPSIDLLADGLSGSNLRLTSEVSGLNLSPQHFRPGRMPVSPPRSRTTGQTAAALLNGEGEPAAFLSVLYLP